MKAWFLVVGIVAWNLESIAHSQVEQGGTVVFANSASTRVRDALTEQPLLPGTIKVGLYYSTDLGAMPQPDVPEDTFALASVTTLFIAGVYIGGTVSLPGTMAGQMVLLQVRVWSASYASYAQALANNDPLLGVSNLMGVQLGGGIMPPPSLVGNGGMRTIFAGAPSFTNIPIAIAGYYSMQENTTMSGQLVAWDRDGSTLAFSLASPPAIGSVYLLPNGHFTYTPNPGSLGTDTFSFSASDGQFSSLPGTITIDVVPKLGSLVFNNGSSSIVLDERTARPVEPGVAVAGLYVSTDLNAKSTPGLPGDPFRLVAVTPISDGFPEPMWGRFNGGVRFVPGTFPGQAILVQIRCWSQAFESFETAILEAETQVGVSAVIGPLALGQLGQSGPELAASRQLSSMTLRDHILPHSPTAIAASFSASVNDSLKDTVTGADPDGDTLTFSLVTPPGHGTLTLLPNGQFIYTPFMDYVGLDAFAFLVNDGSLHSLPATVTIQVESDTIVNGTVLFANAAGTRVIDGRTGQPAASGEVKAGLYYSSDLNAMANPNLAEDALVLIRATAVLDGGLFSGGPVLIPESVPGGLALLQVRVWSAAYSSYAEAFNHGDALLGFSNLMPMAVGGATLPPTRLDVDGGLQSITAGSTPPPQPPVAQNIEFILREDISLTEYLFGIDDAGEALVYTLVTPPTLGSLDLQPDGRFTYSPHPNLSGTDTFTYLASDGILSSAPAVVSLAILPVNDLPTPTIDVFPVVHWFEIQTNLVILSPNNSNAVIYLDGLLSSDADGDTLDFAWFDGVSVIPFAVEGTTRVTLDIGEHAITLQADDGKDMRTSEIMVEVLTPGAAVEALILEVSASVLDRNRKSPLLSTLKSAAASFDRGSFSSGTHQLDAFLNSVEAKLKKSNPDLARQWTDVAAGIIRTVSEE